MQEGVNDKHVTVIRKMKFCQNNEVVQINMFVLTFSKCILPDIIKTGVSKVTVEPYIPKQFRCFICQKYGHDLATPLW